MPRNTPRELNTCIKGPCLLPRSQSHRGNMWSLLVLLWTAAGLGLDAAPAPALPPRSGGHDAAGPWKEYPVALVALELAPTNKNSSFKPILPGTDHGLYNKDFFEGDIVRSEKHAATFPDARADCPDGSECVEEVDDETHPQVRNAVTDPNLLWPYGTVVYKVADDVGCPESPQCEILMSAMEHYHQHSCIRFKEWTGEDNYVTIFFNSDSSGACWSPVGRVGDGEQRLSLGQRCWYKGIVIHELGHAIGFWHEMNRPDRDDWIYVYWHNIIPGFASAFRKHNPRTVATLGEKFDYRSIMMYDEYAFSKDGRSPTLQAVTGEEIGPIWRKKGLSDSDKRRLQKLYNCDPTKPKPGYPYDVHCDFNKHVCSFKNGGSAAWNWRTVNQTDGYVYTSYDTAGTKPGHFVSINFPPISSEMESVRGPLGCVRFYYLLSSDGYAKLQLEQAYLKRLTQLTHDESATFELWSNDTANNEWIHMEIPLYITQPFKLIFTSLFNETSTHGTIALDDVEVLYHQCNPKPEDTITLPPPPTPVPTEPTSSATSSGTSTTSSTSSSSSTSSTSTSTSTIAETSQSTAKNPTSTSTTAESTTSSPPAWTTAPSEEKLQLIQLQQQQQMLAEQQILELEQQKLQQQQLLALQQQLQQHFGSTLATTLKPTEPSSAEGTTFPSYQTVSSTEPSDTSSTTFTFPITLGEAFDISTPKIPNMPNPTNKIPMKNPHPHEPSTTTTQKTLDYDSDWSQREGR